MNLLEWVQSLKAIMSYFNAPHRSSTAEEVFRLTELYILWTLVGFFIQPLFFFFFLLNSSMVAIMAEVETIRGRVTHMYVLHQC